MRTLPHLQTLASTAYAARLDHLCVVVVSGADAREFLQGQLSNDVDALFTEDAPEYASQLSAYCNPKGRALAVLRLVRADDGFWLLLPMELAENVVKRLRMYVLRAQVEIAICADLALLGRWGEKIGEPCADRVATLAVDGAVAREILVGAREALDAELAQAADGAHWRRLDIGCGVPQVFAATSEEFVPQMLNLDLVDGVSFSKGCYPGQEIVARLRYLGKAKQRLRIATCAAPVAAGDGVYSLGENSRKVGSVVDAVDSGCDELGGYLVSASVPVAAQELRVGGVDGAALQFIELPYPLPPES